MKNTTFKKKAIRHGEVLLLPINELPENVQEESTHKEFVVAHSETGHDHVAVGDITVFLPIGADSEDVFLRVNKDSKIEHRKTFDFHETKALFKGLYKVIIKNDWDYFKKALKKVRD